MQIIMLTTMAGPDGVRQADSVHDVPADEAKGLIKAGAALKYSGKKIAAKISPSEKAVESAQLAAAETQLELDESNKQLDAVVKASDEFKKESAKHIAALEKVANDSVDELAKVVDELKLAKKALAGAEKKLAKPESTEQPAAPEKAVKKDAKK